MLKIILISIIVVTLGITVPYANSDLVIPQWVKNLAGFWYEGKITDKDFALGIAYLIEQKIIQINDIKQTEQNQKNNMDKLVELSETHSSRLTISVHTNKQEYGPNDKVMIFGNVNYLVDDHHVGIVVSDSNGKVLAVAKILPNVDGSYGFVGDSPMFREFGQYSVNVYYGGQAYDHTTYSYKPKI